VKAATGWDCDDDPGRRWRGRVVRMIRGGGGAVGL